MTIQIECPCGTTLKIKDEASGREVHCRSCRRPHLVPSPPVKPRLPKPQSLKSKPVEASEGREEYSIRRSWLGDELTACDADGNVVLRAVIEGRELLGIPGSRLFGLIAHTFLAGVLMSLTGWHLARFLGLLLGAVASLPVGYFGSYCCGLCFDMLKWRRTLSIFEPGRKKPLLQARPVDGALTERRFELSGRAGSGRIVSNRIRLLGPFTRVFLVLRGHQLMTVEIQEQEREREPVGCLQMLAGLALASVFKYVLAILLFPLFALAVFLEANTPLASLVKPAACALVIAAAAACAIFVVLNFAGVVAAPWLWFRDESGEYRFVLASRGLRGQLLIPKGQPASPELCLLVSLLRIARIPNQFIYDCQIADAGFKPLELLKKKEAWQ